MNKFFLITGCGRSGTGYLANLLAANGVKCGHEKVFGVKGVDFEELGKYSGDSSWFAPLWMKEVPEIKNTPVVHVVRNPHDVTRSFYRLGVFSDSIWGHVFANRAGLSRIGGILGKPHSFWKRVRYVNDIRAALAANTDIFSQDLEIARCYEYWYEWNLFVERSVQEANLKYFRVNLEDLGLATKMKNVANHLEIDEIDRSLKVGKNRKKFYGERPIPEFVFDDLPNAKKIRSLSDRYGYGEISEGN